MDKKYVITFLIFTFIFLIFTFLFSASLQKGKYVFQALENKVLVGDTQTGEAWICTDKLTHDKLNETQSYSSDLPKDFNGCISFSIPRK